MLLLLMSTTFLFLGSCQKEAPVETGQVMLKSDHVPGTGTIIWGPEKVYAGKTGLTKTITLPSDYESCYTLTLQNGDASGVNMVSGVTVTIDGVTVISSTDLRKKTIVTKSICDKTSFTISVSAKGKSTNFVTLKLEGWPLPPATFTDLAGKTYPTVKIGTLTWMAENLAYLPFVNFLTDISTTDPRYYVNYYYLNVVDDAKTNTTNFDRDGVPTGINCFEQYGVLYNYPAALASCPVGEGWRLPTKEDWEYLGRQVATTYESNQNNDAGIALKSTTGWNLTSSDGQNGTNSSGFNGLPGNFYRPEYGFQGYLRIGSWWSQSPAYDSRTLYIHSLSSFYKISSVSESYGSDLNWGRSVRYVKGTLPTP